MRTSDKNFTDERSSIWAVVIFTAFGFIALNVWQTWFAPTPDVNAGTRPVVRANPPAASVQSPVTRGAASLQKPDTLPSQTVVKCVVNGRTLYADSETDCASAERVARVDIDPNRNLSDGLRVRPVAMAATQSQRAMTSTPNTYSPTHDAAINAHQERKAKCTFYDERIKRIDERTRQPLSAGEQDGWREKRRELRDAQFALRC